MATRSKSGLLPILLLGGAAVLVFGGGQVVDTIKGLFSGSDTEIIGTGDHQLLVTQGAKSKIETCDTQRIIQDKKCGDTKVVVIDAGKMPYIARNISLAWAEGHKFMLTRDANDANRDNRYRTSCRAGFTKKYPNGSCDEFEFASTHEGGNGARIEEVPRREQNCQGGTLSTTYRYLPINDGEQFVVVISNPDKIAKEPYAGVDIAKDQSCGI